jgi:hypothetical protein
MRISKHKASEAARTLGQRSVKARKEEWGEDEFNRRLQEWGKLGGRPKGSGKTQKKGGR